MRHHIMRCWHTGKKKMCPVIRTETKAYSTMSLFGNTTLPPEVMYAVSYTGLCDGEEFTPLAKDVMQCSGITDVNGKDIYEGDIVSRTCLDPNCNLSHVGVVKFNSTWAVFQIEEHYPEYPDLDVFPPLVHGSVDPIRLTAVTILGDKYRNPNLLNPPPSSMSG